MYKLIDLQFKMHIFSTIMILGLVVSAIAEKTNYCDPTICKPYQKEDNPTIYHSGCPNNKPIKVKEFQPTCTKLNAAWIALNDDHKKLIVKLHNIQRNFVACGGLRPYGLRSACRIGVIRWDDELAETAAFHVQNCIFAHDKCRATKNYPYSGQNIGQTVTTKLKSIEYYIRLYTIEWFKEYCIVEQKHIDKYDKSQKGMTGHFLTSLNERNTRIGCAAVTFDGKNNKFSFMLTCNYPVTNIRGVTVYNSCKNSATKCNKRDQTYKQLCSIEEKYDWKKDMIDFISYDGNDKEGVGNCGEPPEGKGNVTCPIKSGATGGGGGKDEYFEYDMGPGFSSVFPWRQKEVAKYVLYSISFSLIVVNPRRY